MYLFEKWVSFGSLFQNPKVFLRIGSSVIHIYFHTMSQGKISQGKISKGNIMSKVNILGFRSPSKEKGRKKEND